MRLAFVGGWGHAYLRGALKDPTCNVTDVAVSGDGHDDARARTFAEGISGAKWFDDPARMLDTFKPDAVDVGAVYGYAGDVAALCLEHDVPTVSDKPVAASWEQLRRIKTLLAANPRRVLATEFPYRCDPAWRAARDAVRAGRIGDPVLATSQKSYRWGGQRGRPAWYADRAAYGGTMLWVASHAIDWTTFVVGKPFVRVFGAQGNLSQPQYASMEDHVIAVFEMAGGSTAIVHADYLRPVKAATHGDDRLRLAGTEGVLEIRDGRCRLVTNEQEEQDITEQAHPRPVYLELLATLHGEPSEYYGNQATLSMAAIMLHARDAADRRCVIEIPPEA